MDSAPKPGILRILLDAGNGGSQLEPAGEQRLVIMPLRPRDAGI